MGLAFLAAQSSPALAQSKDEQSCINVMNKGGAKVAANQGKENAACVAGAGKGTVADAQGCLTADPKEKIAKAKQKVEDADAKRCSAVAPPFGYTSSDAVNDAAGGEELALVEDVFGAPLDAAIAPADTDPDGAKCQAAVIKTYEKHASARRKAFLACKKNGLKGGSITSAAGLEGCAASDPNGKVAGARGKIEDAVEKKCPVAVDLAEAFPGDCAADSGSVPAFAACIGAAVECRTCTAINAMDDIAAACDQLDDGMLNGSCEQCGNGLIELGEDCDDGPANSDTTPDACRTDCSSPACGDSVVDTGESCDDGGVDSPTCNPDCTAAVCGDGYANAVAGELCDTGGDSSTCDSDCTPPACPDSHVNVFVGESCDDGNSTPGDGCSPACTCEPGELGPFCQDLECPASSVLVLRSGVTGDFCLGDPDCDVGTCDTGKNRCVTDSEVDVGWTGITHDSDINDGVVTRVDLLCPGPFDSMASEPCGECFVAGLDPAPRSCRCSNDNSAVCNQPLELDPNDCGIGLACTADSDCQVCSITTSLACLVDDDCPGGEICLNGLRRPTCSAGQCVGTCNCYLSPPIPVSSGSTPACVLNKLASDTFGTANVDTGASLVSSELDVVLYLGEEIITPCPYCTGDGVAGDGVRDGTCVLGEDDGAPCDADAINEHFPAPGGDGHSLDCFPLLGKNVSGSGLDLDFQETTGTVSLGAGIPCGFAFDPQICPCSVCSDDVTVSCSSNGDCVGLGVCRAIGSGNPRASGCTIGDTCDTIDGIEGECSTGPDNEYCDGVVRANGEGFVQCTSDQDCDDSDCGVSCGACTLVDRSDCFPDPVLGVGAADPETPATAAVFCIPPTASVGINDVAGLPGPARVVSHGRTTRYCASAPAVAYLPGVGGCPATTTTTTTTSTTTTTIGCAGTFPACGGSCPPGQSCQVMGAACVCMP